MKIDQQWHGYKRGHQLLGSSIELAPRDQEIVDKLSDASGSPRLGERFDPYLTIYPLPSGRYHVVSRTWQDLEAPRSGTVFTRSLLIGADEWRGASNVMALFDCLNDRNASASPFNIALNSGQSPKSVVDDPNLAALTEALFLEKPVPIAAFGFSDAELIAGRLLEALWASRRASMAICTYALAPRSLGDRDFDLVFSPESARPRFAKWSGRRVVASSNAPAPRHVWTKQISDRIFSDPYPNLSSLDEIGAFNATSRVDGSALRLALVWADLKGSVASTPRSLLGMLDILRSFGRSPWSVPGFASLVVQAVDKSGAQPTADTWQFLQILVRKLDSQIPLSVVRAIWRAARELIARNPAILVQELSDEGAAALPHLLRPAAGAGLERQPLVALSVLQQLGPSISLSLMAESPALTRATTVALSEVANTQFVEALSRELRSDRRAAMRMAGSVAAGSRSDEVTPLLQVVLEAAPTGNFTQLAINVLTNGGSSRASVIDLLYDLVPTDHARRILRSAALNAPSMSEGDRLLMRLAATPADMDWLVDLLDHQPSRLSALLMRRMAYWPESDLRRALSTSSSKNAFLEAAIVGLPGSSQQLARLLKLLPQSPVSTVAILRKAAPSLSQQSQIELMLVVIDQIMASEPASVSDLLEPLLGFAGTDVVVLAATSPQLSPHQIGKNIAAIADSRHSLRYAARVDLITTKLSNRRAGGFERAGYDGWATLLREARRHHPAVLIRSADQALDFAITRYNEPVGAVVAAVFPVVHARLADKGGLSDIPYNIFTAVFIATASMFTDWDKAKSARHGLVDAFMRSSWEPAELLRAGLDSEVLQKILNDVNSRQGGSSYIRKIERSVDQYPEPLRSTLRRALKGAAGNT